MFWPFRASTDYVVLRYSEVGVKVVRVRACKNGWQVLQQRVMPCHGSLVATLSEILCRGWLIRAKVIVLLEEGYRIVQLDTPNVGEIVMEDAIRSRVQEMVGHDTEQGIMDYVLPSCRDVWNMTLVVLSSRGVLRRQLEPLYQVGIDVDIVTVPEVAQSNLAAAWMRSSTAHQGVALLSFSEHGGLLTFSFEQNLVAWRCFPWHSSEALESRLEGIYLEVVRAIDLFDRRFSEYAIQSLVVVETAQTAGVCLYLSERLFLDVSILDLPKQIQVKFHSGIGAYGAQVLEIAAALRVE